ncbi:MAG TPA: hypothetical protein VIA61_15410 [Methylomirabilota bacterium]|jgi:hypothetical protein
MDRSRPYTGIEGDKIETVARAIGLDLEAHERDRLALAVRHLIGQVRAAEGEFEHDDPFPVHPA